MAEPLIDLGDIEFLITRENATAFLQVHLAQRGYLSAMDALKVRNEMHDEVAFKSELVRLEGERGIFKSDPRKVMRLEAYTEQLFKSFPSAIQRNEEAIEILRQIGIKRYSNWFTRKFGKTGFLRLKDVPKPPLFMTTPASNLPESEEPGGT